VLRLSALIDALNKSIGQAVYWLVLLAVLISAGNATIRYTLDTSSNAWLEVQWYLFSAVFLLCSGYTLLRNEHVRIDIVSGRLSKRTQAWIDVVGNVLFLLPMSIIIMWLSWPMVADSYVRHEFSEDAGGLLRWPVKILIPIGFFLLSAQGVSELIKRVAFLMGLTPDPTETEHDIHLQHPSPKAPE
jgi:TRAP-type mannitol/chloroaromatic compound transport system permease small subunit